MSDPPLLEARGLRKTYGGIKALAGVDFTCRPGEVQALVGENGAGKSTLIKLLTGAVVPDAGEIQVGAELFSPVRPLVPGVARDLGIVVIHQEFNLLPHLTVAENVFLGKMPSTSMGWVRKRETARRTGEILRRLGADVDPYDKPRSLSVASQQLVEIAKALAWDARVLLMDEPSAVLGGRNLERLFATVRTLRDSGVGVVYISHRLEEVFEIADRVTVLKDGMLVDTRPVEEANRGDLVRMMVGRSLERQFPERTARVGEPVLRMETVPPSHVVDRSPVSLEVRAGEILGIGGMVGSGRTRLLRSLFGLAEPLGKLRVVGRRGPRSPKDAIRLGIGFIPEDRKGEGLFIGKPVGFNMVAVAQGRLSRFGFARAEAERRVCTDLLTRLGIKTSGLSQTVGHLSGGNQQKVVLAKWMAANPRILMMDEPTRGVDVAAKAEVYAHMRSLTEQGLAIIMVSSEMPELLAMSDRIAVMRDGRIVGQLSADEATEERVIALATGEDLLEAAG